MHSADRLISYLVIRPQSCTQDGKNTTRHCNLFTRRYARRGRLKWETVFAYPEDERAG